MSPALTSDLITGAQPCRSQISDLSPASVPYWSARSSLLEDPNGLACTSSSPVDEVCERLDEFPSQSRLQRRQRSKL